MNIIRIIVDFSVRPATGAKVLAGVHPFSGSPCPGTVKTTALPYFPTCAPTARLSLRAYV